MRCDLCGSEGNLVSALVEGSLMSVCDKCLRFGKQVERNKSFSVNEVIKKKIREEDPNILKKDYNILIKQSREKLNLTQEELAKKLNEKESLIQKIEKKELIPSDVFIKKVEAFFKIKLYEQYEEESINLNLKSSALTIGDLLKLKKFRKSN